MLSNIQSVFFERVYNKMQLVEWSIENMIGSVKFAKRLCKVCLKDNHDKNKHCLILCVKTKQFKLIILISFSSFR